MEQEKKSKRGGYREGSGRPATGRSEAVSIRITPEARDVLRNQHNQNEFVDRLIIEWAKKHK